MTHVINAEKELSNCLTIELMDWYSVKPDADTVTFHPLIFDQYQQGKQPRPSD